MKLDRRSFLSLGVGVSAGITLSPIPWKLMDDLSIWSQNWPWTPVPPDGKATYENSACTLCPGGCGITVRKIDDRIVKIEGMTGHPVNNGRICMLGLSGPQLLYGPTRVKSPMKKVGEKFKKISWEEAISEIVSKLDKLRSGGKPEALACITGTDKGTVPELLKRFLTAFGSPNYLRTASVNDSYEIIMEQMQGVRTIPGFDFENADFILSFGSGIIDGWGSPVRMLTVNSLWKEKGVKVVQIEPRLSNSAAKADKWIPIVPGTEADLALGLACVIIKKSLYDKDFVNRNAVGFENLKRFVMNKYTSDQVEKITGIDKSVIEKMAVSFAKASSPIAICGKGQGRTPGSINEFAAVHALNALVGNINKKGGVFATLPPDYIRWSEVIMDGVAQKGLNTNRIDGIGSKNNSAGYLLNRLPKKINSSGKSPVEVLFVSGANPCYSMADTHAVNEAFDKIPFIVSFSSYMDETAKKAHLILPNHTYLERYEDVPVSANIPEQIVGLTRPVVKPQYDTMNTGDVIIRIAKSMGDSVKDSFPWSGYESCLRQTLGGSLNKLARKGFLIAGNPRSASGKFRFTPAVINSDARIEPEGDANAFPLILIPKDSMRLTSGFIGSPPFLVKTVSDTVLKGNDVCIEINPETAKKNNLSDGDYTVLSTPKGSARVKVNIFDGIMPGIIAIPRGLGHTAYDDYLAGKGINYNSLVGPVEDPVTGLDVAWGIRAKLS